MLKNREGAGFGEDEGDSVGEGKQNTRILEVFVRKTIFKAIIGNR